MQKLFKFQLKSLKTRRNLPKMSMCGQLANKDLQRTFYDQSANNDLQINYVLYLYGFKAAA